MKIIKIIILLGVPGLIALGCHSNSNAQMEQSLHRKAEVMKSNSLAKLEIKEKWELPSILEEVSGIAYLEPNRFACVQDELGTIFIYNTSVSKIEKEVSFAGDGDYEGLAIAGETAYVVRSDGKIFEVLQWNSENQQTLQYDTPLTEDHNVEGLCYDKSQNRLLLAIKGSEAGNKKYKGIYAFDLSTKKMSEDPVYQIDLTHPIFEGQEEEKLNKVIQPSEINIHPETSEIYLTDAKNPKILILNTEGEPKKLYPLNKENFEQAEGIAFSPSGELFISNEGKDGNANILKVFLKP